VLYWLEKLNLKLLDKKELTKFSEENQMWKLLYERYIKEQYCGSKRLVGKLGLKYYHDRVARILKSVKSIFRSDFDKILEMLKREN
jgi:hypothetical protein